MVTRRTHRRTRGPKVTEMTCPSCGVTNEVQTTSLPVRGESETVACDACPAEIATLQSVCLHKVTALPAR